MKPKECQKIYIDMDTQRKSCARIWAASGISRKIVVRTKYVKVKTDKKKYIGIKKKHGTYNLASWSLMNTRVRMTG